MDRPNPSLLPVRGNLAPAVRRWNLGVSAALVAALVAACAPPIDTSRPGFAFAKGWQNGKTGGPKRFDEPHWWRGLNDPVLDGLVTKALAGNPDLAAAQLRARAAQQETGTVRDKVAIVPGAEATLSGGDFRTVDKSTAVGAQFDLDFDLGRTREAERFGAAAAASVADAESAAARLLLIGEVVGTYLSLRHAQATLAQIERGQQRQKRALAIATELETEGEASRVDGLRGKGRLAGLEAERLGALSVIEIQVLRLAILTGAQPGALPPNLSAALNDRRKQPQAELAPDPKVPADLLRNRPDLRIAEGNYDAARAALGASRAALYPRLSLTGLIDTREIRLGGASRSGELASLGPSIRLPVMPPRAAKAAVTAATTRVEAAHKAWTAAVLNALFEVEAALLDYRRAAQVEAALSKSVAMNAEAYALTQEAAKEGEASLADLADLEAELFDAELRLVDARLARARSFVNLNLRVGSGSSVAAN